MSAHGERPGVLVVDDKRNMLSLMSKVLGDGVRVLTAESGEEAVRLLEREAVQVVLCDLKMEGLGGLDVLVACKRLRPQPEFILMTAYATVGTAVEALRLGAYDYLTKPFDPQDARAIVMRALGRAGPALGDGAHSSEVLPGMLARSRVMHELGDLVRQVANSAATTLILGETGTGKERVARAVHELGPRASQRFIAVNCAAIPAELLESELFGYTRGAFTGAARDRAGLFEESSGGSIFLDEIGDMRPSLQAKLTRVLEERTVRRIGDSHERAVDMRIVAATHRDLESMVHNEAFREDLWYRLNVAVIRLPPLRARRDDIELLAVGFLRELAASLPGRRVLGFSPTALSAMEAYDWPGNVRQLRAAVERACVVSHDERIQVGDLPPEVRGEARAQGTTSKGAGALGTLPWGEAMERGRRDLGRAYLQEVLERHDGNVAAAAEHAGVERESFYRLLRRYEVEPGRFRDGGPM